MPLSHLNCRLCREFNSRNEAEIVRELLLANGIESFVTSDDCGAVDHAPPFARGVQLYVAGENAPEAERILAKARAEIPESESADDDRPEEG